MNQDIQGLNEVIALLDAKVQTASTGMGQEAFRFLLKHAKAQLKALQESANEPDLDKVTYHVLDPIDASRTIHGIANLLEYFSNEWNRKRQILKGSGFFNGPYPLTVHLKGMQESTYQVSAVNAGNRVLEPRMHCRILKMTQDRINHIYKVSQ